MSHFYLYGPSGSGKSTVGPLLAERLGLPFVDLDAEIESAAGISISEIFAREGETGFRARERAALDWAAGRSDCSVVALGGGALLDPASHARAAETGKVICLRADAGTLLSRLQSGTGAMRPLLAGEPGAAMQSYLEQRAAHYAAFDLQLDTTQLNPAEIAAEAGRLFGAFRLAAMGAPYDVRASDGLLDRLPRLLESRGLDGPFAVVADTNTAAYARQIAGRLEANGSRITVITIEPGEDHKTIKTLQTLLTAFLSAGLDRGSTVLAAGGGVVGDLAGFAAAVFLRGIDWVAVPTSLLAMVDAGIGGKTGADLPQGKNLVGAFHPPRLVAVDPHTLRTLPERELRNGLAEMVKAGVIGDPTLFERCAAWDGGVPPVDWITRSMAVKIRIIEADPFERGLRAVLNFGHTVGHAVEHVSGYRLAHGEAVAIGMAVESRLAERIGAAEAGVSLRIESVLQGIGLPTRIPADLDPALIAEAMYRDKKVRAGRLRFALPKEIGTIEIAEVDASEILPLLTV